jgi:lysophospholipase L1-like esterase
MTMLEMIVEALQRKAHALHCATPPSASQIVVKNFGVPGATLTPSDLWYESTSEYGRALAINATLVVIMLGTNDSKEWRNASHFIASYHRLIQNVRKGNRGLPVIILSPPPCYPGPALYEEIGTCKTIYSINCQTVRRDVRDACRQAAVAADGSDVTFLDVFSALVSSSSAIRELENDFHASCPSELAPLARKLHSASITALFSDGVHPTHATSDSIAAIVAARVVRFFAAK